MSSNVGNMLRNKRNALGLSVKEVVNLLAQNDINISIKTLYGWENGNRQPDADTFITLCKIYNIDSFSSVLEIKNTTINNQLQHIFDSLNPEGQNKLIDYAQDLSQLPQYKKCDTVSDQEIG